MFAKNQFKHDSINTKQMFRYALGVREDMFRVDLVNCGCTDCCIGESKPINCCSDNELYALYAGLLSNASGQNVELEVKIKVAD